MMTASSPFPIHTSSTATQLAIRQSMEEQGNIKQDLLSWEEDMKIAQTKMNEKR